MKKLNPMKLIAFFAVSITGLLLLSATPDFPAWGDPHSPASESVLSRHYIEDSRFETQVPNLVTAVLADYRAFDTMFETVVILVAGIAIIGILRRPFQPGPRKVDGKSDPDLIQVVTCRLVVPVLQLFALYVIAHGHHSPGGGFQGGVMLGASFILMALTGGLPAALERLPENRALFLAGIGVLIFAGTGLLCMFYGQNFLDYDVLHNLMPGTGPVMARSHSMLIVEIGVALTVCTIMFSIYAVLSSRGEMRGGL